MMLRSPQALSSADDQPITVTPGLPQPRSRAVTASVLLMAAALLAAIGGGWLLGGRLATDEPAPAPPAPRTFAVSDVRIAVDGQWQPARVPAAVRAAGLADVRAFAPTRGTPAVAWFGRVPIDDQTLLPASLRAALGGVLPKPAATTIAGRPGWAYRSVHPRGGRIADVTVLPMTAGSLVIACDAPASVWVVSIGCERGVRSITGRASLPPSSVLAARLVLPGIVARLNADRRTVAAALGHSTTSRSQARATRRLAVAHRAAALRLSPLLPAERRGAVDALHRTADAYRALAATARHHQPAAYKRARLAVRRTEAALQQAVAALSR